MQPIVSQQCRIRHPQHFRIGEGSILDDFCYISTRLEVGRYSHVCTGCSFGGGAERLCRVGDFSSLSAGVRVWCASDDYVNDLVCAPTANDVKEHLIAGDVLFERCTAVGANAVVMPANTIPEGVSIGALSFVPPRYAFEPWTVYAGIPIRPLAKRNRDAVLRQMDRLIAAKGLARD